jgi:hypothetical protein
MTRSLLLPIAFLILAACQSSEALQQRHGSPLYTYACNDDKTFQTRQIISGEVEVTAGGQTRDVTTADGELVPGGPRLVPVDEATRLTGMPGGPYEACFMDDGEE